MLIAEPRLVRPWRPVDPPRPALSRADAAPLLKGLNREQRRAVTHLDGPALVIAGPGTGKTEVVTRRVAWLVATRQARPREILALTFTDNAAQEMQARVDLLVPYGQADTAIHTFHAFGDRLVREHAFELGLNSDLRLLNRSELVVLLRKHLFELGLDRYMPLGDPTRFLGALIDLFARAKDEGVAPLALSSHAAFLADSARTDAASADLAAARSEIAVAYERYVRILAHGGFIDHSDQVALALRLLRERPSVQRDLSGRYRFILVDELQDTNTAQLELVLALGRDTENVMAVGDPDQGIYGFRGARTGNVERFRTSFHGAKTIVLRRNYRSLAPVIEAAERAISANRAAGSQPSQIARRTARGAGVKHVEFLTPEDEADGVAVEIERRICAGARPSDFAVLVRSNTDTDDFARSLRVRGIAVDSGSRARLTDVSAVRGVVAFLRVVADPGDSLEMFALAAAQPYVLAGADLASLLSGARRRNRSLFAALAEAVESGDERLDSASRQRAVQLIGHVRSGLSMSADHTTGEVLYDYLRRSGRLASLALATNVHAASEARSIARFCELVRSRSALVAHDRVPFLVPTLDDSWTDDEAEETNGETDGVKVLTAHRSKGLEFRTVFVSRLVDGRFPVRSRPPTLSLPVELAIAGGDDGALAEERRLFYVALTRACDELVLTSHQFGPRGRGRRRPSVFIAETIDKPPAADGIASARAGDGIAADLAHVLLPPVEPEPAPAIHGRLTLSFSQIDEYLTCPERYRLKYDIRIPTPAHHALSYGTAIHQAIAAFHAEQKRGVILTDDQLVDQLRRNWQPDGFISREHEDARFAAGCEALTAFRTHEIASGSVAPAAVERPFTFRLGRDEIRGRIDRIDATADGAVITDYKSSDVREQKRADAKARDSLQLQVYALAHEAETGSLPKRVQLHFVESGVIGSAEPARDRLDKAREKLVGAADHIRARHFEPKPSAISCGYCPFRSICTATAA